MPGRPLVSAPALFSIDTHALYWFEMGLPHLSDVVLAVFDDAAQGLASLLIHPIVLAESYYVLRKSRLEGDYPAYLAAIEANPLYRIEPILIEDLRRLNDFPEIPEMHDRLIAIQAVRLGAVLVTRDRTIQTSPQVALDLVSLRDRATVGTFKAGDGDAVDEACGRSAVGKLLPNALYVHRSALDALDPLLRVFEGWRARTLGRSRVRT